MPDVGVTTIDSGGLLAIALAIPALVWAYLDGRREYRRKLETPWRDERKSV